MPESEPTFSASAEEALAYLDKCAAKEARLPQLVLLDLHLPQPEIGWQLLQELRARYPALPIVVLSAYHDSEAVRQAYQLGAHSFIGKPFNRQDWKAHFEILRTYWLDVVTLPPAR